MDQYYLVTQEINKRFKSKFKIGCPTNLKLLKQLLDAIPGYLTVHLVDYENNSKKNVTTDLGRSEFDLKEFRKKYSEVGKYRLSFPMGKGSWVGNPPVVFYGVGNKNMPEKFFLCGHPCSINFASEWDKGYELDYIDEDKEKHIIQSGQDYEKFIGSKYEDAGYEVIYNGIEKGVYDGGIDLIVQKENSVTLVQCKNWVDFEGHKLTAKDFRAFLGDCYLHLMQQNIDKISYHYIISDDDMLGTSAKMFLGKHPFVQCKTVPFIIEK